MCANSQAMTTQPNSDFPPRHIDEELASAIEEIRGYADFLEFRLPRNLSALISLPTADDFLQETYLIARANYREFWAARNRRAWLSTLMRRVHSQNLKRALTRHRLMLREFGEHD